MTLLRGKTALVTGATNGIGKETALALARMGATLVIVGRNRAKTEAIVSEIQGKIGNQSVEDLQSKRFQRFFVWRAYSTSKLANVLFTYELARRLRGTKITANALNPGFVATGFGGNSPGLLMRLMRIGHFLALTSAQGAKTETYLASSPEVEGVSGKYFSHAKAVASSPASYDPALAQALWQESAHLTKLEWTI